MARASFSRSGAAFESGWVNYIEPTLGIVAFSITVSTIAVIYLVAETLPNDFTVFMESARWLRRGVDFYQHPLRAGPGYNLNTPAAVLMFVPLSFLRDALAMKIWTGAACLAYLLTAYWITRAVAPGRILSVAAAIFISQPAITSMLLGQIGAALALLVTAAWLADRRDRPLLAGVLTGLAIAAKPFLVVLVVYAVWRRSRRFAAGLGIGIAAVLIVGLLAGGIDGYRSWIGAMGQISWTAHVLNGSIDGLVTRTLSTTPAILHATPLLIRPAWVQPLWVAGMTIVGALGAYTLASTRNRDTAWALLLVSSLLISPLGWVYYATMFVGPLLVVALTAKRWPRALIAAGYACLILPPMTIPSLGSLGILVFGSIFAWGFVLIFAGIVFAERSRVESD